jgi:hypothetical protein
MNGLLTPLLAAVAFLCACNASEKFHSGNEQVSIKTDGSGNVSFKLPFAKGVMKLPEAVVQNGHFDIDGVKMIPGGTIHGFNIDAGDKGALVRLAFDAPKSPQEVRTYFVGQFKQRGDEVSEAGNAISGKTKDGESFVINVEPSSAGTSGTIRIQSTH